MRQRHASPLPSSRVDERDTMFARAARRPGTAPYQDYYQRHPERQAGDDRIRMMPRLMRPGGRHYDRRVAAEALAHFDAIPEAEAEPELVERWRKRLAATEHPTAVLRQLAGQLGAVAVGCTNLPEAYLYTHRGRLDETYGQAVSPDHGFVLVFLVEMDFEAMQQAPRAEVLRETGRQYERAARIAKTLAAVLQADGHQAKAHFDAHYDLILPPLAVQAGLGELGRNNILIADRHGSRVRIGAVSTDLELRTDRPIDLGANAFCAICKKCADNCPAHALSLGDKEPLRGVPRWPTQVERCYRYWRWLGTDCGICIAVCPFSHRSNWLHNTVRWLVRHWPACHRLALWLDDRIYGRSWHR